MILRTMLGGAEHMFLEFSASEVPADAHDLACLIVTRLGGVSPSSILPEPRDADTARDAWIRDHLTPALVDHLRAVAGSRKLWLVIDDLEKHFIPETSARRVLERLYHDIRTLPFLRILLIGLSGAVPGAPPEAVWQERTRMFSADDVEEFISRRMVEAGKAAGNIRVIAAGVIADAAAHSGPEIPKAVDLAERWTQRLIAESTGT